MATVKSNAVRFTGHLDENQLRLVHLSIPFSVAYHSIQHR